MSGIFPSSRTIGNRHENAAVKSLRILACLTLVLGAATATRGASPVHIWEKHEVTLTAARSYANPYTDVTVWLDLSGPGFRKRIYGFWDGGQVFRVRLLATASGTWSWRSGSNPEDPGLSGKTGVFTAIEWTEDEKRANPIRRGLLRPTPNHHALEQADGTPFFVIGDTWYSAGTNRFKWYDDDQERPIGPGAGFKDYVRYRKAQHHCVIPELDDRREAVACPDARRNPGSLRLAGVRHRQREEHGQRRRTAFHVPGESARV